MVTRADICAEALTWLETPWHHRACVKHVGTDCVRLHEGVCKALGLLVMEWEPPHYSATWHFHQNQDVLQQVLTEVGAVLTPLGTAQPGDLLGFVFGRVTSHLALLLPDNYIIHAARDQGKVVRHTLAAEWVKRLRVAYALPGVEP